MSDADQVMEILKDKLRKSQAEVEALRLKTRNPEEHIDNYEGDCEHLSARCAECRWPLWTKRQVALIDRDAKQAYHLFHGDLAPDDCVHCELETLRTDARKVASGVNCVAATHPHLFGLETRAACLRILAKPEPAKSEAANG